MQRLLDAVASTKDQVQQAVGGAKSPGIDTCAEATTSASQATQDPETHTNDGTVPPAAAATEHTSPATTDDPEDSNFVVVSDPTSDGDNAFTVYSAEQLDEPRAAMASSNSNPNGAPKMNWPPSEAEMKDQDGPRSPALKASRAYSVASPAADPSRRAPLRADNPGSIPTAGGVALGGRAMQEREYRRKSRISMDMPKNDRLDLDGEGSPDVTTANNTEANTIPAKMNADDGEGSSKVEPDPDLERKKSPSAPEVAAIPDAPAAKEDEAPVANENEVPPAPATENATPPTAAPPKERRGSTLDNVLGKLKLGKKK